MSSEVSKAFMWVAVMTLPVLILLTKDPAFRVMALSVIYPGVMAGLANTDYLKVDPIVPIIA